MAIALDTLAYARRLREAGFSEEQAEGQAEALAAAMTDTLATRQDLRELEVRMDARFAQIDARFARVDARFDQVDARFGQVASRFDSLEKQLDIRFTELEKRFRAVTAEQIADLDRRITTRMLVGIGAVSALVKLL